MAYLTEESLRAQFIGTWAARGTDPQRVLDDFLGPDLDPEAFWATAGTNLHAGKIRLIFVADEIPRELQRIVEFLNQQMDPAEVLGVEIKQYTAKGEGLRTLVPRVVGHLAQPRRTGGRQWDESSFFEDLARRSRGDVAPARAILAWAREKADWIWWGKGDRSGSFIPMFGPRGSAQTLVAVWTYGSVEVQFQWMTQPPFSDVSERRALRELLNEVPGVAIPESALDKRPAFPLSTLADKASLARFLGALDWAAAKARAAGQTAP